MSDRQIEVPNLRTENYHISSITENRGDSAALALSDEVYRVPRVSLIAMEKSTPMQDLKVFADDFKVDGKKIVNPSNDIKEFQKLVKNFCNVCEKGGSDQQKFDALQSVGNCQRKVEIKTTAAYEKDPDGKEYKQLYQDNNIMKPLVRKAELASGLF
jgi:hypothetical protein